MKANYNHNGEMISGDISRNNRAVFGVRIASSSMSVCYGSKETAAMVN